VRNRLIGAAIVAAALTALGLHSSVVARAGFIVGDFRAFYCAARVAAHGADPYRTEPLRTCETGIGMSRFFEKNRGVTIPAPLPGYAIAALVPLSILPFAAAAAIWTLLLLLAWYACVATLTRFAGIPWEMGLAVFALSLGMLSLPFGEVVPISLACISLSAYFAWKGRAQAAALAAAGSMIEPHLGLPVCVALACWRPSTRLPLALALAVLAALSTATLGLATNVEYFTSVLPAHALSEATRDTQYSLTAILSALGLAQSAAVRAGTLWYVVMVVAGTFIAGRIARTTRNDAFVVCVPPAFAVFGGTFIHVTQIAAAIPAAVLLMNYTKRPQRELALLALLLLAVPWGWSISPALILAPLVPIGYVTWRATNGNVVAALVAAIGAAIFVFGLQELYTIAAPHFGAQLSAPKIDANLPEASWSGYSRGNSSGTLAAWAVRLPTWFGLALLLALLVREAGVLRTSRASLAAAALVAFCTLLPIGAQFYGDRAAGWLGIDARAYYCAATALRQGKNPYEAASLHDCERDTPAPYYRPPQRVTVPAPYPPYALAIFAPLTVLPFAEAMNAWWMLLALAIAVAAYALAAVTRAQFRIAWAALALAAGLTTFSAGNVLPIALAALIFAALAVVRKSYVWAAVAATVAMVEPHIALPAVIALLLAAPAVRLPLGIGVALLGVLSLIAAGFAMTLQYFTAVIPAHALAEISRDNQYSLSTVLAAIGFSDTSAAIGGTLSYAIATAGGVIVGLRLAQRYAEPAAIVLIPPAFSLLGGSFVHTAEIAAAVPAAVLLVTRERARAPWLLAALVLLAVPWMMATSVTLLLAPLVPVAYLLYAFGGRDRTLALAGTVVAYAIVIGLFSAAAGAPHVAALPHPYAPIDPRLAEASWRDYVLGNSTNNAAMWLLRLPTWLGLLAFVGSAVMLARRTLQATAPLEHRLSQSSA
jgi:hypothetical protein